MCRKHRQEMGTFKGCLIHRSRRWEREAYVLVSRLHHTIWRGQNEVLFVASEACLPVEAKILPEVLIQPHLTEPRSYVDNSSNVQFIYRHRAGLGSVTAGHNFLLFYTQVSCLLDFGSLKSLPFLLLHSWKQSLLFTDRVEDCQQWTFHASPIYNNGWKVIQQLSYKYLKCKH